jgi:hypothetical protein
MEASQSRGDPPLCVDEIVAGTAIDDVHVRGLVVRVHDVIAGTTEEGVRTGVEGRSLAHNVVSVAAGHDVVT